MKKGLTVDIIMMEGTSSTQGPLHGEQIKAFLQYLLPIEGNASALTEIAITFFRNAGVKSHCVAA